VLTIKTAEVPSVPNNERVKIEGLSDTFTGSSLPTASWKTPSVERGLLLCRKRGLNIDPASTSFFLSRRVLRRASRSQIALWQDTLFIWLAGSAEDATAYFQIPSNRVVDIGTQVAV